MNFITIGNKKNPAVLFLHGWGGEIDSWGVIPYRIAGFGFYSIVVDFPGFGCSAEPLRAYGVEDYAVEINDLLKSLNVKDCAIVAHSFGGRVAIKMAVLHKNMISRLILVDSAGVRPRRGLIYKYKVWSYKRVKRKLQKGLITSDKLKLYGSSDYRALSSIMKATFCRVVNEDLLNDAKNIDCKTLLIWGRNDRSTPLYMARKLKGAIKGSRLEIYDAGHFSYLECLERFIDEIYMFIISS